MSNFSFPAVFSKAFYCRHVKTRACFKQFGKGLIVIINPLIFLQELVFLNGDRTKSINIEIVNDDLPEPDEVFEVILSNPKNGLVLGTPSRGV